MGVINKVQEMYIITREGRSVTHDGADKILSVYYKGGCDYNVGVNSGLTYHDPNNLSQYLDEDSIVAVYDNRDGEESFLFGKDVMEELIKRLTTEEGTSFDISMRYVWDIRQRKAEESIR